MNLRILKKLSSRAAPYLAPLGDRRGQFRAVKAENFTSTVIYDHKGKPNQWAEPLKGTIMVGAVSGYYEPEWDEETAWDSLKGIIRWSFVEYDQDADELRSTREINFRRPGEVFRAAEDLLAAQPK